jgi:hypothetical protein
MAGGRVYGLTANMFVTRKAAGETYVLGGMAQNATLWTRVLSQNAAYRLWFRLTQGLFPEHADQITAHLDTTPLRDSLLPTITTSVELERLDNGRYELVGLSGGLTWTAQFDVREAHRLWESLDAVFKLVSWQTEGYQD